MRRSRHPSHVASRVSSALGTITYASKVAMAPPQGAAGDDTAFELRVNVHDGRHFPLDASFEVRGVFDNEVVCTGVSRASTNPSWGSTLVWRRSSESVRKLQSQGAKLKLTGASFFCPLG